MRQNWTSGEERKGYKIKNVEEDTLKMKHEKLNGKSNDK